MSNTAVSVLVGIPGVANFNPDGDAHRRQMAAAINRQNQGKFNCTVNVTLNPSTGSTTIADNRIGFNSAVTPLMAMTRNAALAIAAGIWFDAPSAQAGSTTASIVAHHTASSAIDQTIRFGIFG